MIRILDERTLRFLNFLNRKYGAGEEVKLSVLNGYDAVSSDNTGSEGFAVYVPPMKTIMLPTEVPENVKELGDEELEKNFVIHNLAHEYGHFLQDIGVLDGFNDENRIETIADEFADKAVAEFTAEEATPITPEQELLKLVAENPGLPVVAMVDAEIVCDDCGWWLGKLHSCRVDSYIIHNERVLFEEDAEEELLDEFYDRHYEEISHETISEREREEYAEARALAEIKDIKFKKAIVLYVSMPSEDDV